MLSVIPHLEPCCNSMLSDVMTILNDNPGCGNGDIKAEIEEEEKTIILYTIYRFAPKRRNIGKV